MVSCGEIRRLRTAVRKKSFSDRESPKAKEWAEERREEIAISSPPRSSRGTGGALLGRSRRGPPPAAAAPPPPEAAAPAGARGAIVYDRSAEPAPARL